MNLHAIIHLFQHLFHELVELPYEIYAPPYNKHHRPVWRVLIFSTVLGIAVSVCAVYFFRAKLDFYALAEGSFLTVSRLYPLWLPIFLITAFGVFWMRYIRTDFIQKSGSVLLEVRLPREIERTPRAMELFFAAIWEKGSVTYAETYWDGKLRPWFSFEMASFGGEVHFYVWTIKKYRNTIESQIYAQYPTVEITEVPDYTSKFRYNPPNNFLWGTYYVLMKPDAYPIMTYVDFGLDKETEEEFKVDPITSVLEFLGSMKKGEQVWIQILTKAHWPLGLVDGRFFKQQSWKVEAQEEVDHIMRRHPETKSARKVTEAGFPIIPTLSEGEKKQVEAIDRSMSKPAFECAIRACYCAEKEVFNMINISISGLLNTFRKPYASHTLNMFKLGWFADLSDPVKDLLWLFGLMKWGIRKYQPLYAKEMLNAFRQRSFFFYPFRNFHSSPMILTTEELATIYHFPGKVSGTPTLERVPSKKVEPPSNLPI